MNVRRGLLVILCLLAIGWALAASPRASAHGGVVIQTGNIEGYEYLVQVYPFPLQPGVGVLSLFLFDYAANGPALGFEGEVYLAAPGESQPCCQPGVHRGPFQLYVDPVMYPGDYTTYLPLDAAGEWQAQFRVRSATKEFELLAPLTVESQTGQQINPSAIATQAAVMGLVAQSMQQSSQPNSPLASSSPLVVSSPLTTSPRSLPGATTANTAGLRGVTAPSTTQSGLSSDFVAWVWWGMAAVVGLGAVFSVWQFSRQE